MPEIKFTPGTHVSSVARQLASLANINDETYTGDFGGITLVANPGDTSESVEVQWWRQSDAKSEAYRNSPEGERAARQAAINELMRRFETLDYEDLDQLVQFFDDMAEPSDHIGTSDRWRIVDAFAEHGLVASMNSRDKFDGEDRENYAKYLIGQALGSLSFLGLIMSPYSVHAAQWRDKFKTA